MDILTTWTVVIFSLCICRSKQHAAHLKCINIFILKNIVGSFLLTKVKKQMLQVHQESVKLGHNGR